MDWNFIRLYLAVYGNESMSEAASKLKISESTLFRQLNNVEKVMGKMFIRQGRNYSLTELGEELLPLAKSVGNLFNEIDRKICGKDEKAEGTVRITAPTSFSYNYFPSLIENLHKIHPNINIELLVSNDLLNLSARQADIAVRVTNNPPEHFIGKEVKKIGWGVYAGYEYLVKHGTPNSICDLNKHNLIGASGKLLSTPAFAWLEDNLNSSISSRTDDLVAMRFIAETNNGVVLLPDEFNQGSLKKLFTFDECEDNKLWILTHPDMRNVKRISLVMQYLLRSLAK